MPWRISLPATPAAQPVAPSSSCSTRTPLTRRTTSTVAVDDRDVVDRHRPGGRQRLRLAGRRARTRCRASSTRSCARRGRPRPRTARCRRACTVADGVDVVVDAHERDARGRRRRSARAVPGCELVEGADVDCVDHHVSSRRSSLPATAASQRRPQPRHGQALEDLVEEAGDDQPLGDARRARRGSRGRSAAPRRRARRPRRGCSGRRCSRSRGWAPTRPTRRRRA